MTYLISPFQAPPVESRDQFPLPSIHFVILNAISGMVIGALFGAIMLLTGTVGIFTLIQAEDDPILATLVFIGGCIPRLRQWSSQRR
jgi:hypothetical protein